MFLSENRMVTEFHRHVRYINLKKIKKFFVNCGKFKRICHSYIPILDRTRYVSSCSELSSTAPEQQPPSTSPSSFDLMGRLRRSPSLPPIHSSPSQDDGTSQSQSPPGDETSGYNSDCSWPATRRARRERFAFISFIIIQG